MPVVDVNKSADAPWYERYTGLADAVSMVHCVLDFLSTVRLRFCPFNCTMKNEYLLNCQFFNLICPIPDAYQGSQPGRLAS